jgi:hypothetical protein
MHGGGTPLAREAAKKRLLAMCEPAFAVLLEAMQDPNMEIAVKAAVHVLNRAGFGPQSTVAVEDKRGTHLGDLSDADLVRRSEELLQFMKTNAESVISDSVDAAMDKSTVVN